MKKKLKSDSPSNAAAGSGRPATVKNLWAPIICPKRGAEWINWTCVRLTKRDARAAACEHIPPIHHKEWLANVRFARVSITESQNSDVLPPKVGSNERSAV